MSYSQVEIAETNQGAFVFMFQGGRSWIGCIAWLADSRTRMGPHGQIVRLQPEGQQEHQGREPYAFNSLAAQTTTARSPNQLKQTVHINKIPQRYQN